MAWRHSTAAALLEATASAQPTAGLSLAQRSAAPTADSAVPLDRQADEMLLRLIARVPDKPMSRCCRPMQHATHTTTHANPTHCSCNTHDTLFVRQWHCCLQRTCGDDRQPDSI